MTVTVTVTQIETKATIRGVRQIDGHPCNSLVILCDTETDTNTKNENNMAPAGDHIYSSQSVLKLSKYHWVLLFRQ